ncbi:cyclin-dependent kinase regulatory subunit [Sistotremastrum niveocremeum HHB9708]|uniref:Cyclin-dependent kinases regulatory subunit n=2 Tax=Sistotremastraceae TaxID=3402574 RepID=A0A164QWX1_9AGAM|nr:cyclin-dependent kinase regulatory subunit [Sistotremastrum niveocremeum HHB9708]KZT39276.1 CKS-domain-containing protein [Sistotremastrum suecicum HHB10207 ss-3]
MATKQLAKAQQVKQQGAQSQRAEKSDAEKLHEFAEKIHYSERYSDDEFEYRHVIVPKPLLKLLPKQFFSNDGSGCLRLLSEQEWRAMGISQSLGWVHYEVHAPEPHVLLFRRALDFQTPQALPVRAATRSRKP